MAELKTKKTVASVETFLKSVKDKTMQSDSQIIIDLMKKATKAEPKMWGGAIIGFGDTKLKYESGRELEWFVMGFSPRKAAISLYIPGTVKKQQDLLKKLGKHKTGKGCVYVNKLEDVDLKVLKEIISASAKSKIGI